MRPYKMIGFDLTQELKVTNLRMLNFRKKQLIDRQRTELDILKKKIRTLRLHRHSTSQRMQKCFHLIFHLQIHLLIQV